MPEEYVAESVRIHNAGGPPVESPYGYLWWISREHDTTFRASGFGGQQIAVATGADMVFITATTSPGRAPMALARFVIPSIRDW